jgi:hypothetical protein
MTSQLLKDIAALENEEPAFRLFTDVFSRFVIRGTVETEPQPQKNQKSKRRKVEFDETSMTAQRRVIFAIDEKVKISNSVNKN